MTIIMRGGEKTGIDHIRKNTNRQDAIHIQNYRNVWIGTLADGCGSGKYSETGARRSVQFFSQAFLSRIKEFVDLPDLDWNNEDNLEWIIQTIQMTYDQYLDFLEEQISVQFKSIDADIGDPLDFAENHLLNTLLSIVIVTDKHNKHYAWIFSIGDGYILINDNVEKVEDHTGTKIGNKTIYPALALSPFRNQVDKSVRFSARNDYVVFSLKNEWERIAISSDGIRCLTSDQMRSICFAEGDDDQWAIQINIQFAADDGWLENDDDIAIISLEKVNE